MNPFDFVNSINFTKENIMKDDLDEKSYNSFVINRSLSYFNDTILFANEMNRYHHIDNRLQYDFFINIIRKRKRFSKWYKPDPVNEIEIVKEYYGYSDEKARDALTLLSDSQIQELKRKVHKGGKNKQ